MEKKNPKLLLLCLVGFFEHCFLFSFVSRSTLISYLISLFASWLFNNLLISICLFIILLLISSFILLL